MNVYFHTFGCRANQYDTELVRQAFTDQGAVVVDDPATDLAVVNSCTVTHESETKLRRLVRAVSRTSHAETIVMGCAAVLDDGSIAALPSVRAVVANADPDTVLRAAGVTTPMRVGAQHAAPLHLFGLGADVIAGFPGETEVDHRASVALLRALPFSYLHVFPFSARPDAAAARLPDRYRPA